MYDKAPLCVVPPTLRQAAHAWVIRLTSGDAGPDDVAAARAWCETSPEHQQAFVEARRLWELTGQLQAPARARMSRRHWAMASAALLVLGVGLLLARPQAWDADYRTGPGERREVQLADGSHVTLDADSAMDIELGTDARRITLRRGTALFDVAHDAQRPFSVQVGEVQATALGTIYAVQRQAAGVDVTVRRGRVAVSDAHQRVVVKAGEQVLTDAHGLGAPTAVDVDTALAWQQGRLVFDRTPLAQVLERIEHYRPGFILIGDEKLRALKISGTFQIDRLDDGLATLEQIFPLRVKRYTRWLLVLQPGPAPQPSIRAL